MSKYEKGTPQYEKRLAADRERKARKRAEQKAASLDMQTPPEQIEKAPESAMQEGTHIACTPSESRILDHEDFVRMSRRHA
jgi:hypothetical protein